MDDMPVNDVPDRDTSLAELLDDLAASEAELAAGQHVSGEEILDELRESVARLEARRAAAAKSAARDR